MIPLARPSAVSRHTLLGTLLAFGLGCGDGVGPQSEAAATSLSFDSPTLAIVRGTSFSTPTATVHVTARDAQGNVVPPPPSIVVTSSDPSVVYFAGSTGPAIYSLQGLKIGAATLTASFTGLPPATATVNVVEVTPPATSLAVTTSKTSIYEGEQFPVTGTVRDGAGNVLTDRPVLFTTGVGGEITPTSSTSALVIQQPLGQFGSRTVHGRIPEGLFTDLTVAVIERRIVAYEVLNEVPLRIPLGSTVKLNLAFRDSTGQTIRRGPPNLAVLPTSDLRTGVAYSTSTTTGPNETTEVLITGGRAGAGTLTVSLQNRGNPLQFDVPVTVFQPAHVEVTPSTSSIAVGATKQLAATVLDDNGAVVANDPVGWNSSNTGIATVSGTGLVTGVGPGTATITATSQAGRRGTAAVTVTP
jgi:uncharacterized protein YjdB